MKLFALVLVLLLACAPVDDVDVSDSKDVVESEPVVSDEPMAPVEPEPVVSDESVPEPSDSEVVETVQPVVTEQKSEVVVESVDFINPALRELLRKSSKVSSISFAYGAPPKNTLLNKYHAKGDKVRVDLYRADPYKVEEYFDTVWLNSVDRSAVACCVELQRCISKNVDRTKDVIEAKFDDYFVKSPLEWAKDIPFGAQISGSEMVEGRAVTVVKFSQDDEIVRMWIDSAFGIPLRVVFSNADEEELRRYVFSSVSYNAVKDDVMSPVCVKNESNQSV